jgi:hypothetical protein
MILIFAAHAEDRYPSLLPESAIERMFTFGTETKGVPAIADTLAADLVQTDTNTFRLNDPLLPHPPMTLSERPPSVSLEALLRYPLTLSAAIVQPAYPHDMYPTTMSDLLETEFDDRGRRRPIRLSVFYNRPSGFDFGLERVRLRGAYDLFTSVRFRVNPMFVIAGFGRSSIESKSGFFLAIVMPF